MLFILNRDEKVTAIFTNNGSPDSCPYYEDLLKESLDTGTSSYEFKVPANHPQAQFIEEGGYVVRRDLDGNALMFTIMQIEEEHSKKMEKFIYCENTGMEIINAIFRPARYDGVSATTIMSDLLQETRWEIGIVEDLGVKSFNFEEYDNKLLRLQQVANEYEAEVDFVVELENGEVTKRLVNLRNRRGTDTQKRFTYNKDIERIKRTVDMTEVVTALIGVGKGDEAGNDYLTFDKIEWLTKNGDPTDKPLNQDWVGDEEALRRYGRQGRHIFGLYEYNTASANELLIKTWDRLQELKEPTVKYELDVALLEQLANMEQESARIGDTVIITDEQFEPALTLEARIRELEISFTDPSSNKAILGNFKERISNITQEIRDIQKTLLKKEPSWSNNGEHISKGDIAPEAPEVNDLWIDTSTYPNIFKRWNGAEWVKASPTTASEVGAYDTFTADEKISIAKGEAIAYTNDEIEDINIGGENLQKNTDFEDLTEWTTWAGTGIVQAFTSPNGVKGAELKANADGELIGLLAVQANNTYPIIKGKEYTASAVITITGTSDLSFDFTYIIYDNYGNTRIPTKKFTDFKVYDAGENSRLAVWTFIPNNSDDVRFMIGSRLNIGQSFTVRHFKVEEGNKATSWKRTEEEQRTYAEEKALQAEENAINYTNTNYQEARTLVEGWKYPDTTVIDGGNIYTGSILANSIASKTITANEIKSGTITTDLITTTGLDAKVITAGVLDANKVQIKSQLDNYSNITLDNNGFRVWNGFVRTVDIDRSGNAIFRGEIRGGSITSDTTIDVTTDLKVGGTIQLGEKLDYKTLKTLSFSDRATITGNTGAWGYGISIMAQKFDLVKVDNVNIGSSIVYDTTYGTEEFYNVGTEKGFCGVGFTNHGLASGTTLGGMGFCYRMKRKATPTSITFSTTSSTKSASYTDVNAEGFWMYMTAGTTTNGYYYWRGNYTISG